MYLCTFAENGQSNLTLVLVLILESKVPILVGRLHAFSSLVTIKLKIFVLFAHLVFTVLGNI